MPVLLDPKRTELEALYQIVSFTNQRVVEIGCGDGRLTWPLAEKAACIQAIDPNAERIERARQALVERASSTSAADKRVEFHQLSLEDYYQSFPPSEKFDLALLSWSLC